MPAGTKNKFDKDAFRVLKTPATLYTRETGICVKVSTAEGCIKRLPVLGEAYKKGKFNPKHRLSEFGDYICTDVDEGDGSFFWFYYSLNKSAADALKDFKLPHSELQNHYWAPILLKIDVKRSKVPRTSNTGTAIVSGSSYQAIPIYRPAADSGTLWVLHEYLSPTEPNIPQHALPQPDAINFPVPGGPAFSFPECLHDDLDVEKMEDSSSSYANVGGAVTDSVGVYGPFSFPRTNFKTWLAHTLYERANKIATGAYHGHRMEVIPPPLSRKKRGF